MKTTLDIDDRLLREAKATAAKEQKSLTRLIEEGLSLRLRVGSPARRQKRFELPVSRCKGGFLSGIDPTSNKSILDAMDDDS